MMTSKNSLSSQGSSDMPDLDSGALGLQTSVANDINLAGKMSATMAERVKPPLPAKKSHLNDLIRLKNELDEIHKQKEQAEEMTDLVVRDLSLAQDEVHEKDDQLRRKESELRKCEEELKNWREKVQSLSMEVQEEKRLAAEIKKSNRMLKVAITSKTENESQKEEELSRLRNQVADLTASLAEKEAQKKPAPVELANLRRQVTQLKSILNEKDAEMTEKVSLAAGATHDKWQATMQEKQLQFETKLKENEERMSAQLAQEQELRRVTEATLHEMTEKLTTNSSQEQELRRVAESSLQSTKEQFEAKLREATERAGVQIAELQKRALEAEASLQEHTNRMEVQVDHEPLLQRISSLEAEVQNERQRCDWFKKNSEKLSRKIKETQAAWRVLEQSECVLKRQLDDLKSQVMPLSAKA